MVRCSPQPVARLGKASGHTFESVPVYWRPAMSQGLSIQDKSLEPVLKCSSSALGIQAHLRKPGLWIPLFHWPGAGERVQATAAEDRAIWECTGMRVVAWASSLEVTVIVYEALLHAQKGWVIHLRLIRDPAEWACCLALQPALKARPFTASGGQQDGKEGFHQEKLMGLN